MYLHMLMRIPLRELHDIINEALDEAWDPVTRTWTSNPGVTDDESPPSNLRPDARAGKKARYQDWSSNIEGTFEEQIAALSEEPEFDSMGSFVEHKIDNDDFSFTALELQALARSIDRKTFNRDVNASSPATVGRVKQELTDEFGFKFVPRQAVKQHRGALSNAHGTHPFANMGGGGSGFGGDREGAVGTSHGGGPGAMGGGYVWDKNDPKNLPMGTRKKR